MSWAEFMETKCFGEGIYRPYADFVGDLATQVDNLLGADPGLARYARPLVDRDFVFIRGTRTAVFCLSNNRHRHLPFRSCPEWKDFFRFPEERFIADHRGIDLTTNEIKRQDIATYLAGPLNFIAPLVIGFPAIFIAGRESADWKTRQAAISGAAELVVAHDRAERASKGSSLVSCITAE